MEFFLINHRDPIYGLIIFVGIILIILISNYLWGIFSLNKDNLQIKKLLDTFNENPSIETEQKNLLLTLDIKIETILIIANTFAKSGAFEKAINAYLASLEKSQSKKEREIILSQLGKVYFKAGMFQKAIDIFLEALKLTPRNQSALKYLAVIYEKLKMYDEEEEVLEVQDEQNMNVKEALAYVQILKISNSKSELSEQIEEILQYQSTFPLAKRFAMEFLLRKGESLTLLKDFPAFQDSFDLAWTLKEAVNLEDEEYKAMFYAKKIIEEKAESSSVEVQAYALLRQNDFQGLDLTFSFVCNACKASLPFYFYRCPLCFELGRMNIKANLQKVEHENNLSF